MNYWIFTLSVRKKSIPDVHQPPRDPPHWSAEERVHTGGSYVEERRGAGCRRVHQQDVLVWSISWQDIQVIPNPVCSDIQSLRSVSWSPWSSAALVAFHFHYPSCLVHPVTPSGGAREACERVCRVHLQGCVICLVIKRWSRSPFTHTLNGSVWILCMCVSMMGGRPKLSVFSAEPYVLLNFAVTIITTIIHPYTHICTHTPTHILTILYLWGLSWT